VALLPALRKQAAARTRSEQARSQTAEAGADESRLQVVLADGYSCRTQITDLSDAESVSLAELLAWGWGLDPRR
jgi:Fe-S oxidoreductase